MLKARAGAYSPSHADKGKPVESKGWGVHIGGWPSDTGRQGKHADQGKLVQGEGKGGQPAHKAKAKGWAQWKPRGGHKQGGRVKGFIFSEVASKNF